MVFCFVNLALYSPPLTAISACATCFKQIKTFKVQVTHANRVFTTQFHSFFVPLGLAFPGLGCCVLPPLYICCSILPFRVAGVPPPSPEKKPVTK